MIFDVFSLFIDHAFVAFQFKLGKCTKDDDDGLCLHVRCFTSVKVLMLQRIVSVWSNNADALKTFMLKKFFDETNKMIKVRFLVPFTRCINAAIEFGTATDVVIFFIRFFIDFSSISTSFWYYMMGNLCYNYFHQLQEYMLETRVYWY